MNNLKICLEQEKEQEAKVIGGNKRKYKKYKQKGCILS